MKALLSCVTLQCFLIIPTTAFSCNGISYFSLAIYPEGTINVRYGQPLEIFCEAKSADDLEWVGFREPVPSQKLNATTRRLYIELPDRGIYTYYCRNNATRLVCPSRVQVDSVPDDVTDFTCVSKNIDIFNCSWTLNRSFLFNSTLSANFDGYSVPVCRDETMKHYCTFNEFTYRKTMKLFFLNLQICNVFGCNEQNFTIDHFSIVKPYPPNNLRIVTHDAHSVLLQWSIPYNMVDFLPDGIDHKIEYQIAKIDSTSYFRKVDTSGLPAKNRTYKFLLSDLPYAHMAYEVRIYIRPKEAVKGEFWSDFAYIVFNTANERPNRPPETAVGAFDQASYESKRVLYIYWKQLEEYEEAGANFTYKIVAYQKMRNPKTIFADSKKSLSYVILDEASLGPINIDIWSMNDKDSSLNSSYLYIPPYSDTEVIKVPTFTKLAYENGTYEMSWGEVDNIDNYIVFWCQHDTTQICAGRMNFIVLEPSITNHIVDLPRESRFQFAISANSGMKSSGMVWATCDISKDSISMYGFPVRVNHGPVGKSSVEVTWTMLCTLQEGYIYGYLITYCPVINMSTVCDASVENKSSVYISNPRQNKVNIINLKPYKTYYIALLLNTTFGLKALENASTRVTTTEDTPTTPRNVRVTEVESDSLVISWDPPLHENGVIGYVIFNYEVKFCEVESPVKKGDKDEHRISFKIKDLEGFFKYSWSVMACNTGIGKCSAKSPQNSIFVRTKTGRPSKLKSPAIFYDPDTIKWEKPEKPGGIVSHYQILKLKDDNVEQILNTTNLSYNLENCGDEKYKVRAVNHNEDDTVLANRYKKQPLIDIMKYTGEWSDPITVYCRKNELLYSLFLIISVIMVSIAIVYVLAKLYFAGFFT